MLSFCKDLEADHGTSARVWQRPSIQTRQITAPSSHFSSLSTAGSLSILLILITLQLTVWWSGEDSLISHSYLSWRAAQESSI